MDTTPRALAQLWFQPIPQTRIGSGTVESDFDLAPHHHEDDDDHPHRDHHPSPAPAGLLDHPPPASAAVARHPPPHLARIRILTTKHLARGLRRLLYYQVCIGSSPVPLTPMFATGLICNVFVALVVGRVPALWLPASGTLTSTLRGVDSCVQPCAAGRGADALGSYHVAMWTGVAFGGLAMSSMRGDSHRNSRTNAESKAECIIWQQSGSPVSP
ncbi:hypothetical protein B0H17DRAFT_1217261 [Mycena rosella]|uniref:Uncharacterized protein n=1 Tax=Mycena rosella TaxID=1033263 RepID=A0AAD7FPB2_MYCRO|nr:hypothetical protein B0H17DRAFT_1217261 [Mycena rosella]